MKLGELPLPGQIDGRLGRPEANVIVDLARVCVDASRLVQDQHCQSLSGGYGCGKQRYCLEDETRCR